MPLNQLTGTLSAFDGVVIKNPSGPWTYQDTQPYNDATLILHPSTSHVEERHAQEVSAGGGVSHSDTDRSFTISLPFSGL